MMGSCTETENMLIQRHILNNLNEMRIRGILCDLELVSDDGVSAFVHSPVWIAAFEDLEGWKTKGTVCSLSNKQLDIHGISGITLKSVVDFVYGRKLGFKMSMDVTNALSNLGMKNWQDFCSSLSDTTDEDYDIDNDSANLTLLESENSCSFAMENHNFSDDGYTIQQLLSSDNETFTSEKVKKEYPKNENEADKSSSNDKLPLSLCHKDKQGDSYHEGVVIDCSQIKSEPISPVLSNTDDILLNKKKMNKSTFHSPTDCQDEMTALYCSSEHINSAHKPTCMYSKEDSCSNCLNNKKRKLSSHVREPKKLKTLLPKLAIQNEKHTCDTEKEVNSLPLDMSTNGSTFTQNKSTVNQTSNEENDEPVSQFTKNTENFFSKNETVNMPQNLPVNTNASLNDLKDTDSTDRSQQIKPVNLFLNTAKLQNIKTITTSAIKNLRDKSLGKEKPQEDETLVDTDKRGLQGHSNCLPGINKELPNLSSVPTTSENSVVSSQSTPMALSQLGFGNMQLIINNSPSLQMLGGSCIQLDNAGNNIMVNSGEQQIDKTKLGTNQQAFRQMQFNGQPIIIQPVVSSQQLIGQSNVEQQNKSTYSQLRNIAPSLNRERLIAPMKSNGQLLIKPKIRPPQNKLPIKYPANGTEITSGTQQSVSSNLDNGTYNRPVGLSSNTAGAMQTSFSINSTSHQQPTGVQLIGPAIGKQVLNCQETPMIPGIGMVNSNACSLSNKSGQLIFISGGPPNQQGLPNQSVQILNTNVNSSPIVLSCNQPANSQDTAGLVPGTLTNMTSSTNKIQGNPSSTNIVQTSASNCAVMQQSKCQQVMSDASPVTNTIPTCTDISSSSVVQMESLTTSGIELNPVKSTNTSAVAHTSKVSIVRPMQTYSEKDAVVIDCESEHQEEVLEISNSKQEIHSTNVKILSDKSLAERVDNDFISRLQFVHNVPKRKRINMVSKRIKYALKGHLLTNCSSSDKNSDSEVLSFKNITSQNESIDEPIIISDESPTKTSATDKSSDCFIQPCRRGRPPKRICDNRFPSTISVEPAVSIYSNFVGIDGKRKSLSIPIHDNSQPETPEKKTNNTAGDSSRNEERKVGLIRSKQNVISMLAKYRPIAPKNN